MNFTITHTGHDNQHVIRVLENWRNVHIHWQVITLQKYKPHDGLRTVWN